MRYKRLMFKWSFFFYVISEPHIALNRRVIYILCTRRAKNVLTERWTDSKMAGEG